MSKTNSNSKLTDDFHWFCESMVNFRNRARETDKQEDWDFYMWFLKQAQKDLTKVYIGMADERWMKLMEDILKTISCQLKEISIKYKKVKTMSDTNPLEKLSDTELLDLYKKGSKWLSDHMQVGSTNKNELGEMITPEMEKQFEKGLGKLERLETEMNKRKIVYG